VIIADGSTVSMPDTPENQAAYPQHGLQKKGCGFPIARIVVLLSLATGCAIDAAIGSSKGKLTGEHALFRSLHGRLKPGDIVLADSYYSSFDEVVMLVAMGVDVVMRQAGNRRTDFRRGTKLGREDHLVEWHRHRNRPRWMSREEFAALPRVLPMRELRVRVDRPGFRTRSLVIVTSLLDAECFRRADLAALYRQRWHAELDLRSIKQTMKMDVLRCQTPEMVRKEIWAHLLAYNLLRTVMAVAASENDLEPREISFKGAKQALTAFAPKLEAAQPQQRAELVDAMLKAVAYHRVGNRPGRWEPRALKRRPKPCKRLGHPRRVAKLAHNRAKWY
jgi:hypothetical protein